MEYRVLELFHDLEDCVETKGGKVCYVYKPGETYPRKGKKASKERIAQLAGSENKRGRPVIQAVEEPSLTKAEA